jgi:hypothetical protein
MLDESNRTFTAVASRHVDATVLTHLIIRTLVNINTRSSFRVRSIPSLTRTTEFTGNILTCSDWPTQATRLLTLVNIDTFAIFHPVAVETDTFVAASVVETLLLASVSLSLTLVNVKTGAPISRQGVARWTGTQVGARGVATTKLTQCWLLDDGTFVNINTLTLPVSHINLVARIA